VLGALFVFRFGALEPRTPNPEPEPGTRNIELRAEHEHEPRSENPEE